MDYIKTIVFGLALWCSVSYVSQITVAMKYNKEYSGLQGFLAVSLWTLLYFLTL